MMAVLVRDAAEEKALAEAERLASAARALHKGVTVIGPSPAGVAKVKDQFRVVFYVKSGRRSDLTEIREQLEKERDLLLQIDIL